jgi:very-short-patch-repair endonuclease
MTDIFNRSSTREKRRALRNDVTPAEKEMWKYIRKDALGVRFRRQYGIGEYIADFYCPKLKLVIEIDGGSHFTDEARKYDEARTNYLNSIGVKVVRYTNNDVMNNIQGVLQNLTDIIQQN